MLYESQKQVSPIDLSSNIFDIHDPFNSGQVLLKNWFATAASITTHACMSDGPHVEA